MESVRIREIVLHHIHIGLKRPFLASHGATRQKTICLVEAVDADGVSGWGETVALPGPFYNEETYETAVHILKDFIIPAVLGKTFGHPRGIRPAVSMIKRNYMAKAAMETALWDLYARKNGKPLYQLLGGKNRLVAAGKSIGMQESPARLAEKVEKALQEGFQKIKIKISPGKDLAYVGAVRKQFPDIPLMADANSAYTLKDMDRLKALDEYGLLMIEQPFASDDLIDHARLQRELKTPVCLDESILSAEDARKAAEIGSCRIINIKIGRVGGIHEAVRIHDLCREKGIPVWCGGMLETGIGRAMNLHLSTLPNFSIPGDNTPPAEYLETDIVEPEIRMTNGVIEVPDRPGFGFSVDRKKIARLLIHRESFRA